MMIRYFNYAVFVLSITIFLVFNLNKNISTNIQTILPKSENKELLNEFLKFKSNKKIFIALKGIDKNSLSTLKKIEKELDKIGNIQKQKLTQNLQLKEFKEEYYLYFHEIDEKKLSNIDVKKELNSLYENLLSSFLISSFDKNDPLSIIKKEKLNINLNNGNLYLKNYGYLSIYNIDAKINSIDQFTTIYTKIKTIENRYKNLLTFSPIYYFVENSSFIKKDATTIAMLALLILLSIYLVLLRNIKLLLNTILALGSSGLIATIVLIGIYKEISVFTIVFGLSISSIAIDYMFHHYFHNNYSTNKKFNQEVFLGFFTTISAFFILSFINFNLITQISYFAIISLLFSYLLFSFIFPKIGFDTKKIKTINLKNFSIHYKYFLIFSIITIIYSINQLNFNFDIKALDYDNKILKQKESFFKNSLEQNNKIVVLLKANSINELIKNNEHIKKLDNSSTSPLDNLISKETFEERLNYLNSLNLLTLQKQLNESSSKIGFKKEYFKNVYNYKKEFPIYNLEKLKSFEIDIKKFKNSFISYASIQKDKKDEILEKNLAYSLSLKTMFEQELKNDIKTIIGLGLISLFFILLLLLIFTKKRFFYAISFLIFPIALILIYLSNTQINILHLFMLFIILSISIDYAIYSTKSDSKETNNAITFSSLSSFAGFGILIFSEINALFSIGIVATIGIMAIFILLFFQKGNNDIKCL